MTADDRRLDDLQRALGHEFAQPELLLEALTHRSYAAEASLTISYERLEFLGDAVLQLAVTSYLYTAHPDLAEGEMAKVRAAVVNERALAVIARRIDLGSAMLLGRGEEMTGGRSKDSILSDVVESVLGAFYLEAGFERVSEWILEMWQELVDDRATEPGRRDFKTRLQERLAREGLRPIYEVTESGPEHAKRFSASVKVNGRTVGVGEGTSKKRAEQEAAAEASERLTGA